MPVLIAIVGALMSGLTYWLVWGRGMEHIDAWLSDRRNTRRRLAARDAAQRAPLKALSESRDGAVALMLLVAADRGEPTIEQIAAIRAEMAGVLEYGEEIEPRLVVVRHAVSSAPSPQAAVDELREMLKANLGRAELNELFLMLRKIAALHGGPTEGQERIIGYAERMLKGV